MVLRFAQICHYYPELGLILIFTADNSVLFRRFRVPEICAMRTIAFRQLVSGAAAVLVVVKAGVVAGSQPATQADHYGYDPKYFNAEQREASDTWYFWTGGGERFWVEMARVTDGNVNLLNYLDSRRHGLTMLGGMRAPRYLASAEA